MSGSRGRRLALVWVLLGMTVSAANAAGTQSLQSQLRVCAAETDAAQRLNCYDRIAATLGPTRSQGSHSSAASRPPRESDRTQAATASRAATAAFGVAGSALESRHHATTPKQIEAVVTRIATRARGRLVVTLDNGQVWEQNQSSAYFPLKVGDHVRVRAAALGSYRLFAPFGRATRVTRIR